MNNNYNKDISHAYIVETLHKEIIPAMQSSDNPEGVLLKIAKDKSFSPSALDYTCKVINTLKVNSTFENAKTASDRGDTVDLLDVEDIVGKYSDDINSVTKIACSIIDDFVGFLNNSSFSNVTESSFIKTASVSFNNNTVMSIEEFASLNKPLFFDVDAEEGMWKALEEDNNNFNQKHASVVDADFEVIPEVVEGHSDLDTLDSTAHIIRTEMHEIEDSFANYYKYGSIKPNVDFAELEFDCLNTYEHNDVDCFKDSIDTLYNNLTDFTKRANNINDTYMTRLTEVENTNRIRNRVILTSDDYLIKAANVYHDLNLKLNTVNNLVKIALTNRHTPGENDKEERPGVIATLLSTEPTKRDDKDKSAISDAVTKAVDGTSEGFTNSMTKMYDLFSKSEKGAVSDKQEHIDKAINKITSQVIFNSILQTDPIISRLSDEDKDTLVENYNSAVKIFPALATNESGMRTFLRSAAQVQGVDLGTLKELAETKYRSEG